MKIHWVLGVLLAAGCTKVVGPTQYDLGGTIEYDFSGYPYPIYDFAYSTDLSRTVVPTDLGNPTAPPSSGSNATGIAIDSAIAVVIAGVIATVLTESKSGSGDTSGGGHVPCPSDLTSVGYCYNNTAAWCDDSGSANALDCGATNEVCSYACPGSEGYADCCSPGGDVGGCYESCKGTVLTSCYGGTSNTFDCADNSNGNTSCGIGPDGYMACVQSTSGGCDGQGYNGTIYYGLTYQGTCDGDVVVYCDATNLLETEDCSQEGKSCDYYSDTIGYTCQ